MKKPYSSARLFRKQQMLSSPAQAVKDRPYPTNYPTKMNTTSASADRSFHSDVLYFPKATTQQIELFCRIHNIKCVSIWASTPQDTISRTGLETRDDLTAFENWFQEYKKKFTNENDLEMISPPPTDRIYPYVEYSEDMFDDLTWCWINCVGEFRYFNSAIFFEEEQDVTLFVLARDK